MMKNRLHKFLFIVMMSSSAPVLAGTDTLTSTITLSVGAIRELSTTPVSSTLTVDTATAGSQPDTEEFVGTYSFTTNKTNQKLYINTADTIPSNVTIEVNATAPGDGGTSNGWTTLVKDTDTAVVTGISTDYEASINYTLRVTSPVSAGILSNQLVDVDFKLAD